MSYVLPASTKLIIIPTPSICTQTLRIFDVLFTGLISSKWLTIIFFAPRMIQGKTVQCIDQLSMNFPLRRPWNRNASKKAAFPRRRWWKGWDPETLPPIVMQKVKKHVFPKEKGQKNLIVLWLLLYCTYYFCICFFFCGFQYMLFGSCKDLRYFNCANLQVNQSVSQKQSFAVAQQCFLGQIVSRRFWLGEDMNLRSLVWNGSF